MNEENRKIYKALWAATEAEAAALDFLKKLNGARDELREIIEREREGEGR